MVRELILSGQSLKTPLTDEEKIVWKKDIENAYANFLVALGYNWEKDPNMKETPKRVAKMYIEEITKGVYIPEPKITIFPNQGKYDEMIFQGNIKVKSLCSHHQMPFIGHAFVAYIPEENGNIIGLSKLNRIVDYFARRPQLQEQLTTQVHNFLENKLGNTKGIAVVITADHMCVSMRGVEHESTMSTSKLSGVFKEKDNFARIEFFNFINNLKKS